MNALAYHEYRLAQINRILVLFEDTLEKVYRVVKDFPEDLRADMAQTIINQDLIQELDTIPPMEFFEEGDLSEQDMQNLDNQFHTLDDRFVALNLLQTSLFSEDGIYAFRREARGMVTQSEDLKLYVRHLLARFGPLG